MKNIFKLFGLALLAGSMMLVSCDPGENTTDPDAVTYTITATSNNDAWGTVTGAGTYAENATATLTATAAQGYEFVNWSDGNTENPRTITVTANASYVATFRAQAGGSYSFNGTNYTVNTFYGSYKTDSEPAYISVALLQDVNDNTVPYCQGFMNAALGTDTYEDYENRIEIKDATAVFSDPDGSLTGQAGTYYKYGFQPTIGSTFTETITAIDINAMTISATAVTAMLDVEAFVTTGETILENLVVNLSSMTWEDFPSNVAASK